MVSAVFLAAAALVAAIPEVPVASGPAAVAPTEAPPPLPPDGVLESAGAVFGRIDIRSGNIFDPSLPEEDNPVFRAANRLHIRTRPNVIRSRILFREGDPYSRHLMEESERLLRTTSYLYDAKIRPIGVEGNRVNVEVVTRDVWTLRAGLGLGRAGGVNTVRIGLEDANFLGFGKDLSIQRTSTVDRTEQLYRYGDPALFSSRVQAVLGYSDNSDGKAKSASFVRPFFSLETRWACGMEAGENDREEPHYELGEEVWRFRQRSKLATGWAGFSRGLVGGRALRWSAGLTWDEERFGPAVTSAPGASIPPDRTLSYPWIGLESVRDGFVTARDLDKIERTEDLNLAQEWKVRFGRSTRTFGADEVATIFDGGWRFGAGLGGGTTVLSSASVSGRRGEGGFANVLAQTSFRWLERNFGRHLFQAALFADAAHRLDPERQLLIGGEEGLRGYPLRYEEGDRRVLLTLEQRFYSSHHLFQLFYLGGAVFFDVGRAWFEGGTSPTNLGWLRDVGLGLRVQSSRSAHASMLHFDVAYPFDGEADIRKVQVSFTTAESF